MIEATYDLSEQSWTVTGDGKDIVVKLTDGDASILEPRDLRFGWTVVVNGEQDDEVIHPPGEGKFVEIKNTARFYGRVRAYPDDEVDITFFAFRGGAHAEANQSFTVPRPAQPFPSWTWEDGAWAAPVPYPSDGNRYEWDEETQSWATVDLNGEQGDLNGTA